MGNNATVERELKLEAPREFSLARLEGRLDGYGTTPVELRRLHTIYYDTSDLRLARWGCSLRFRLHDGWTLKLPVPGKAVGFAREEHVFEGNAQRIPPQALDLATAYLRGEMPKPVAELRTLRSRRHLFSPAGDDLAEVVEDDVWVVEHAHVIRRFRQLEIELIGSTPETTLETLADLLRREGAGPPDPIPKNLRALGMRACEPEITVPKLDGDADAGDVVRGALTESVEALVRYDAKLRLAPDADAVHDARVAVRRMRSDLKTFLPVLDRAWASALREKLAWLGDGLAGSRDADVLLARLHYDGESLPDVDRRRIEDALGPICVLRDEAYARLARMLREERYVELLAASVAAAQRPIFNAYARHPACDIAAPVMAGAWKALRKAVRKCGEPPADRDLHNIRIKAKRVRYAAEALTPVVGGPARTFAKKIERLQTILGEQHDAVVACEEVRKRLAAGGTAFLAGELAALENHAAREGRSRWKKAWRKASRKRLRFWRRM